MIIIKVGNGENIERALKRYKNKFTKTKVVKQLRDRQEFEKPSEKKRKQKQKAKYVQKFKNED